MNNKTMINLNKNHVSYTRVFMFIVCNDTAEVISIF